MTQDLGITTTPPVPCNISAKGFKEASGEEDGKCSPVVARHISKFSSWLRDSCKNGGKITLATQETPTGFKSPTSKREKTGHSGRATWL